MGSAFHIDGVVTLASDPLPGAINTGGFDVGTGLGMVTITLGGVGNHFAGMFVDHEIDALVNTFTNGFGAVQGSPISGQSWEIDEPGFAFGDIFASKKPSFYCSQKE